MSEASLKLPSDLDLEISIKDNSVSLRWSFESWEETKAAFQALLAMAEAGGIKLDIDNIKPRALKSNG